MNRRISTLLAASLLAVAGCGGQESPGPFLAPPSAATEDRRDQPSLETCVREIGAPANDAFFGEEVEAALDGSGVSLSDALAPPDDDYWLAVDLPTESEAERAARSLATVAAQGMFGPSEVRRSGASIAIVPPEDGPLEEDYRDLPDIETLRGCTRSYAVVPPESP